MKATDLMIGDWVYSSFSDKPVKVKSINFTDGYGWVNTTLVPGTKSDMSLSPIPLTPEILEKNGWWQDEIDGTYHNTISVYGRKAPFSILDGVVINYVHQLQHALRLCGLDDLADSFKI